jgi:hypothetical protein
VAAISTHFEKRLYPAVDAADKESCIWTLLLHSPNHATVPVRKGHARDTLTSSIVRDLSRSDRVPFQHKKMETPTMTSRDLS